MSILAKIAAAKAERLAAARRLCSLSELKDMTRDAESPRDFRSALKGKAGSIRLIAELKKASPSKGLIRKDFDPASLAAVYEKKGVNAVSVLTEEDFFQGSLSFLSAVRKTIALPLLRKDFIIDDYQIYESRVRGADAVLLIAALLDRGQAEEYIHLASELKLSVLFEIHNEQELEKALLVGTDIIGINNRDLKTLSIDLATSIRLKKNIPPDKIVVSESGIRSRDDVEKVIEAGIDAVLIGTSLMEAKDIGGKIDELLGN